MDYESFKVNDVESQFKAIKKDGHSEPLQHLRYFSNET